MSWILYFPLSIITWSSCFSKSQGDANLILNAPILKKISKCKLAAHPWRSHFWNQGGLNQNHNTQFTNSCWCTHCKKLFLEFRILCCSYLFKEICLEMIKSGLTLCYFKLRKSSRLPCKVQFVPPMEISFRVMYKKMRLFLAFAAKMFLYVKILDLRKMMLGFANQ